MKRLLTHTSTVLASTMLALTGTAHANDFRPYIGADFQGTHIDYANDTLLGAPFNWDSVLDSSLNGFNVHAGSRIGQYFGAELGYFRTAEGKKNVPGIGSSKLRLQGGTLDALGYLPVTSDRSIELIATAGVTYTRADLKTDLTPLGAGLFKDNDSEFGVRVGGGAQYNVTDNVNLRGLVRYQTANFEGITTDVADSAWTYSLGVNYGF